MQKASIYVKMYCLNHEPSQRCLGEKMNETAFFKIKIRADRIFCITLAFAYAFAVLCEIGVLPFSQRGYSAVALFFIFFSLIRFELRENPFWDLVLPLVNSCAVTIAMQIMLSADIKLLNTPTLIGNIALNAAITYLFLLITNRVRLAVTISNTALFAFAFIDYMVISFRGSEIKFSDIYSIRTAASVVSQYRVVFTSRVNYVLVLAFAIFFVLWITRITHRSKKNQLPRITSLLCMGLCLFTVSECMNNSGNYMQLWASDGVKYNGLTYNFLIEARDSRVIPPDDYSDERAEKILSEYKATDSNADTPNIIVIMSEAFSNLEVLGEFTTSSDPLEFYRTLGENCTKGYALSSVFGGNTATSEWEFLTGNTQAFLPYGSVAYQQYIKNEAEGVVSIMNDNGYTTVAMHPYRAAGWRRNVVYDIMGFDEVYFEDDLSDDKRVRGFVSDETLFSDIINRFENKKEGEKLFTFAITMQNHGGYEFGGFPSEVTVEGMDILSTDQYLTLLAESDRALRGLISYFEEAREDTMIVFFGDHQPTLSSSFYSAVMGASESEFLPTMNKYKVPFVIWTNYDSPEEEIELTSLNFLSTIMMKKAGIGLTPYFSYLDSLRERIPVISFFAYYSRADEELRRVSNAENGELDIINEYKTVQYYNIFQ